MRCRLPWMWLAVSGLAHAAGPANPYLAEAREAYQALRYEQCETALSGAARWQSTGRELAEVELYEGLCRYSLGKVSEAETRFELALRIDPDISLPAMTSPRIQRVFDAAVRRAQRREASDLPLRPSSPVLTPPPGPPVRVTVPALVQTPTRPRRRVLPWVLGGSAVASAGAGLTLGVLARRDEQAANASPYEAQVHALGTRARREAVAANVSYSLAAGLVLSTLASLLFLD